MTNKTELLDGYVKSDECPICLEDLDSILGPHKTIVAIMNCCHKFHMVCITKWLSYNKKNKCPLCGVGTLIVNYKEDGLIETKPKIKDMKIKTDKKDVCCCNII